MAMVTIYLNDDAFSVDRALYLQEVERANGNWIDVTCWIEANGVFLGQRPRDPLSMLPFAPNPPQAQEGRGPEIGGMEEKFDGSACRFVEVKKDGGATQDSISHLPVR